MLPDKDSVSVNLQGLFENFMIKLILVFSFIVKFKLSFTPESSFYAEFIADDIFMGFTQNSTILDQFS